MKFLHSFINRLRANRNKKIPLKKETIASIKVRIPKAKTKKKPVKKTVGKK